MAYELHGNSGKKSAFAVVVVISIILILIFHTWKNNDTVLTFAHQINNHIMKSELSTKSHLKFENWIVVTSISLPTGDIEKLAAIDGWKLLVVGDEKTPDNWKYPGCIFLSVQDQSQLGYRILEHLPYGSYTRKNIGYLYAIQHGAKFIYDTDDDNHPTDNLTHFTKSSYTTGIIPNSINSLVLNPYAHFGQPSIWPRGYPLDLVAQSPNNTYVSCQFRTPPVQQGLVNGDPDVDAIFRLTRKEVGMELNLTFDARAPSVTLPTGVFAPYNSQNTFHSYRGLWALLLPTTVAFRVTDIWRGYWAQRLLWLIGDVMAFHPPNAFQKRNSHNYLKDFVDEEEVYEDSGNLIKFLSNWNCEPLMSFFACVSMLSHDMVKEGFWKKQDADVTDAWLADLISVGYKEPSVLSFHFDTIEQQVCMDANQTTQIIFFPVIQNTSYLVPSLAQPENLQSNNVDLLSQLCSPYEYELPITIPSYVFSNILLVIVFNYPNLHAVPLLRALYVDHFPNIVYCANIDSTDWNVLQKHKLNVVGQASHRYSFINATKTGGYFGYECAAKAIEMRYDVDGYFVIGDDVLLNFWKLNHMDPKQVLLQGDWFVPRNRHSNETNWGWWHSPNIGKSAINAFLDDIAKLAQHNDDGTADISGTNYVEDQYLDRTIAINQYIENRYKKNLNMTMVSLSLGDVYYVPGQVSNIFYHVAKVLRKNTVFLEIAVSTALNGILPTAWTNLPGHFIDGAIGDRYARPMKYYNKSKAYLHPVKLGILLNDANFTEAFCQTYVPELIENCYKFQARFTTHNQTTEKIQEKWIVVTSISSPTKDIDKLAAIDGWQLLVIGDTTTPANWNYPGSIFIGVEDQQKLRYNILQHLPYGSYTRKNIGYLYAIEHGAKFIYDTDDDNHPTDNLTHFKKSSYTTGIIFNSNSLIMNPYAHFGQPSIWPRGYPLDLVAESSNNTYVSCQFKTPPVQQGLVNGDPDVDAIFRLTRKKVGMELNLTFDAHAPPVTLPVGVFAPYNSQNTFHSYRGLWALLLPTTVAFRVTDIWRGYWAQRLLWLIGDVVAFHPPNAYQKRNSHNYFKDFLEEETVYEDSGKLVNFLSTWNCIYPMTFFQCVSKLSHDMAQEGFWKKADADLTDAWLTDLVDVGYREPVIVNYDGSSKTTSTCVKSNPQKQLLFFPVPQTTSYLPPSVYESQSLQLEFDVVILSLCPNLSSQIPEKDPSYTFSNTLLILVFNHPYLQSVRLLDEIFSHHFPNMIYCVNINSTDWSYLHMFNINRPESKSRRISFINSTSSSGYFAYECTVQAIEMGYKVDGYFVVGDDVLFNYWNLKTFDRNQVLLEGYTYTNRSRYSNETNWMWWVDEEMGKIQTNSFLDEISELDNLKSSSFKDNVNEGRNLAIEQYIKNRYIKDFNMTTVSYVSSDIYYVPNHVSHIFYHIASIFRKHNVFLEIAVATTLDGLLPIPWADLPGDSLWDDDRSITMNYYNCNKTYLHPVKLGLLENDAHLTAEFCEKYVADLFKNW